MLSDKKDLLLARLNAIGASLAQTSHALALIGLGSVGAELERLDDYSDLDFFAIVESGCKEQFLNHLGWLSAAAPIAYAFRNTADGYKLLYADGVFCEFAVFEEPELRQVPFAAGRIVWKRAHVAETLHLPQKASPAPEERPIEWLVGEAVTNLYVGLCRFRRGEKLSAMRFIQGYAVDRVLELAEIIETEAGLPRDPFALERRFEQRHPRVAASLPEFTQGYERSPESAKAILAFFDNHFDVNPAMKQAIAALF